MESFIHATIIGMGPYASVACKKKENTLFLIKYQSAGTLQWVPWPRRKMVTGPYSAGKDKTKCFAYV